MKQFLAVFLGSDSGKKAAEWDAMDDKARKEREQAGMQAWGNWVQKHKDSLVVTGSPLGSTKLVNEKGVSNGKNMLCAYNVVKAKSHDEAARMFVDHPHFMIFPGDSVEVMECLPIPGME